MILATKFIGISLEFYSKNSVYFLWIHTNTLLLVAPSNGYENIVFYIEPTLNGYTDTLLSNYNPFTG